MDSNPGLFISIIAYKCDCLFIVNAFLCYIHSFDFRVATSINKTISCFLVAFWIT